MTGVALFITATALALGAFMQVLDATIANVAIPTIAGNLGVSTSQGAWVITSFAISGSISVPLSGWLMARYGVVKVFVVAIVLFTLTSLLCGLAWDLPSLVVFRVLQGAFSGPMVPGSQALMLSIFPAAKRGTALALWSLTTLLSPITGPQLGGLICDNWNWRWIFLINVPVGVLCAVFSWIYLRKRETPTQRVKVDAMGFCLLVVWVGALQIMLDTGKDVDWFESPAIVAEAVIAAIGFIAWVIWELTEKHPIVDLSLMRSRNFVLSTIPFALGFAVFFGVTVIQPTWLQTRLGYPAMLAGFVSTPAGIVSILMMPVITKWMSRFDARITATISLLAFFVTFYMRSGYTTDVDFWALTTPMFVQGIAAATFFVSLVTLTLNGLRPEQVPAASGLSNFIRLTTASFAASITTTAYDSGAAMHQTRLAEIMGSNSPAFVQAMGKLQGAGLSATQALAAITDQVAKQAYTLATIDIYRVSAWVVLLAIPCVWFTSKAIGNTKVVVAD